MNNVVDDFLDRLLKKNRTMWWGNLAGETRQGRHGRFLQETLSKELTDLPSYRGPGRQLFFFSQSHASTIDGLYKHVGVEEKCNTLDIAEDLIDGAIHRGIIWTIGNPQKLSVPMLESVSLYVVRKNSLPLSESATDLYFPVLLAIWKIGIHVVFINEVNGEYWKVSSDYKDRQLPKWLSVKRKPAQWDKHIENYSDKNAGALKVLRDETKIAKCKNSQSLLTEFNDDCSRFIEIETGDGAKAAIMDYGNEWRLLELGLLLRSKGYDAVKVIYNSYKHKNANRRGRILTPAGRMVEKNIHDYMQQTYSVIIDWGVPLEISGDSVRLLMVQTQDRREENQIMKKTIRDEIGKISEPIQKKETSPFKDNKSYQDILEKIIWRDQTHVIDSCVKYEIPPAIIAGLLVDRGYYKDVRSAEKRIKRHLVSDTQSKRSNRDIVTQSEYHSYLRKFNFPMPKSPYS